MPVIYEFKCNKCGNMGEVVAPIEDEINPPVCCDEKPMNRVYNISGVVLKGSGFFKTDQRKD